MIINRTPEYKRLNPISSNNPFIDISDIKISFSAIHKLIKILKIKIDKLKLPSFESKYRKKTIIKSDISDIKEKIHLLDTKICQIDTKCVYLNEQVTSFFQSKLKNLLLEFKKVQQEYLKYSYDTEVLRENRNYDVIDDNEGILEQDTIEGINEIKSSIYEITKLILELKIMVDKGNSSINRLDLMYDKSNMNIDKLNGELEILENNYKGFKDRLLNFLIALVVILTILSIIKLETRKIK